MPMALGQGQWFAPPLLESPLGHMGLTNGNLVALIYLRPWRVHTEMEYATLILAYVDLG